MKQTNRIRPSGLLLPTLTLLTLAGIGSAFEGESPAEITRYGCGGNPGSSLVLMQGMPEMGTKLILGVDDPTGHMQIGSTPVLFLSFAPDPAYPCGRMLPGLGMSGPGELLISLASGERVKRAVVGAPWLGAGRPSPLVLEMPADPGLIGISIYVQGALFEPMDAQGTGRLRMGLTEAMHLRLGT